MNERLKQIMLEHGLHKHISEDCQHRMEMLYKLIIQECCQMMMDLEVKYPANLTVREIKKHFGVEDVDTQLRNRSTYFGNNP
jgi:hypothetical protein